MKKNKKILLFLLLIVYVSGFGWSSITTHTYTDNAELEENMTL